MMGAIKQMLYTISNLTDIMKRNCRYVDRTMYLPLPEEQLHYFIRSRRFGKSLFLDMLRCYYDLSRKDEFRELTRIEEV